jgi:hypothetical protein
MKNTQAFNDWMKEHGYRMVERFRRYPVNENFLIVPA